MSRSKFWTLSVILTVLMTGNLGFVWAEDAAPVAVMTEANEAAVAAEDPADGVAADTTEDNLDNLEFASGEAVTFDAATGKLQVKVYLDDAGNPAESTVELAVDQDTEITNGEKDLDATSLKPNVEIDVEYDKNTKKATYIFVY